MPASTAATQRRTCGGRIFVRRSPETMLAALLLLMACGSPGRLGSLETNTTITEAELAALDVATAYHAVERLRPDFLRSRGSVSVRNPQSTLPVVYLAGVRQQGGPDALRQIRHRDVREIQYLNAADATTRFGIDHAGGAIIVILR
jgi:hypothetical protein